MSRSPLVRRSVNASVPDTEDEAGYCGFAPVSAGGEPGSILAAICDMTASCVAGAPVRSGCGAPLPLARC